MTLTLQKLAELILENAGWWPMRRITMHTAANLHKLANGDKSDAIIFDNAGNLLFAVWMGDAIQALVGDDGIGGEYIHAYRIAGKDKIMKMPTFDHTKQWIYWEQKND